MAELVEYRMYTNAAGNKIAPYFVDKNAYTCGEFIDTTGDTYIGFLTEDASIYLPTTVIKITKAQLLNRMLSIGMEKPDPDWPDPFAPPPLVPMTEQEITDYVNDFCTTHGIQ